jgi:outer membrane autotransporter protein
MRPITFRKTLLAMAITATALPAYAATIDIGTITTTHEMAVPANNELTQLTGKITGDIDHALSLDSLVTEGELELATTVELEGADVKAGFIMGATGHTSLNAGADAVKGNLTHSGSITVKNDDAVALHLVQAVLEGNLNNTGTLATEGANTIAVSLGRESWIKGDLLNNQTGKIIANGQGATGIAFDQAILDGKLVNQGTISATGDGATAISLSKGQAFSTAIGKLSGLENTGKLFAEGKGSFALNVDGAHFTQGGDVGAHILNSAHIEAQGGTAIRIGEFVSTLDGAALNISNSGTLIGTTAALDATAATGAGKPIQVNLALNDGSKVTGHLLGLTSLTVTGNTQFNGPTDITMAKDGNIRIGTDASNAGHLSLEQAHSVFTGNLSVAGNSSLGMTLSPVTDADKAVLKVTGTATFADGSQIKLGASGNDFTADGSTYKLIEAGTLDDQGLSVISSSALLTIDLFKVENNEVLAQVTIKSDEQLGDMINSQGGSHNSQQALISFSRDGLMGRLNANDPLYQALANANDQQVTAIAEQMTPQINGGASQAATTSQSLVSNTTSARTSSTRGQSSGEAFAQTGVWVQSLYSDATQGQRSGIAGYNAYSRGIAVGADGKVSDPLTLGLAYSFLNTDVNGKTGNKTKVDSHAFTLYGGFEQGNYFVDASLTYGLNDNEGQRKIAGTTAKADYDSTLLGLNLNAGYTYQLTEQMLVEPRLAARYSLVDIDGYREKGSSAGLKVNDQRFEALELGAGLRVAANLPLGKGTLVPQAKLMAYHDFAADQASSTSTFVLGSTPFVTTGAKAVRNSYEAGVGADYKLGAVTLGLNYDYVGKSGFDADTFTAKVRYDF